MVYSWQGKNNYIFSRIGNITLNFLLTALFTKWINMKEKSMPKYSIKDLEELSGIKAHTLRMWEKRHAIITPQRTKTNIRFYSDDDLKRLLNIAILNRHGIKISHIAKLSQESIKEKVIHLTNETSDAFTQIENLVVSMLDLDDIKFKKILGDSIIKFGFEESVVQIMHPFFEKVGLLWQTGSIIPAQEHFVSNLLRQKLIVAIDGQEASPRSDAKTFILFLHDNELHELGLLFYSYLLKRRGHRVIYLGQKVPLDNLKHIVSIREADYFLTTFTTGISPEKMKEYLFYLSESFPRQKIFFTGYQTSALTGKLPENLKKINSMEHFCSIMDSIN